MKYCKFSNFSIIDYTINFTNQTVGSQKIQTYLIPARTSDKKRNKAGQEKQPAGG